MNYDPLLLSRRRAEALASGLSDAELRGLLWARDTRGVVRPTFAVHDDVTTHLSNAVAVAAGHHAITGWAAMRAHGNTWFSATNSDGSVRDVPILCLPGGQLRRRPGIEPLRGFVRPTEVDRSRPYPLATLARAAFDEARRARGLRAAVAIIDMATSTTAEAPHTTVDEIDDVVHSHAKVRGIVQTRKALAMSSSRSASPLETRTRLLAELDAGYDSLDVNIPVFDARGNLLGVADLLDAANGVVIESDGAAHHSGPSTQSNRRQERFERAGLVVCRVTAEDHRAPRPTADRLAAARWDAQRLRRPVSWTSVKPSWWHDWRHAPRWE